MKGFRGKCAGIALRGYKGMYNLKIIGRDYANVDTYI
jgi:hypothetical protein